MTGRGSLADIPVASVTSIGPLTTTLEVAATAVLTFTVIVLLAYRLTDRVSLGAPHARAGLVAEEKGRDPAYQVPEPRGDAIPTEDTIPPDYLTDEDRVLLMLESNGGQLRQSDIVDQTEWSKSKVSRLLSKMEDRALVEKIAVGRENLIALGESVSLDERPREWT